MCDNRERLIGYVYDECESAERAAIEEHLESCHTCRREIRGLKSVRQDLLAWAVPSSDPIWRPMAPAPRESSWRAVPAWALAAAACATFMVGAAGGAATYALMPRTAPTVAQAQTTVPTVTAAVTPTDLAALENKVLAEMRAEFDTRARQGSGEAAPRNISEINPATTDLARRVNTLTNRQEELYDLLLTFANQTDGIRIKQSGLERDNRMLVSYLQGGTAGIPGGQ
jgi:anti-sigma factor ChrR (cupin superfamily)